MPAPPDTPPRARPNRPQPRTLMTDTPNHNPSNHPDQGLTLRQSRDQIKMQVIDLLKEYQNISRGPNQRTAVLSVILHDPEHVDILYDALSHYVSVLRSRPRHEAESGYVTIYDQALLELLSDPQEPYTFGALLLFLEKIMGNEMLDVSSSERGGDMRGCDNVQGLLKRYALMKLLAPGPPSQQQEESNTGHELCPNSNDEFKEDPSMTTAEADTLPTPESQSKSKPRRDVLPRILETYNTAKNEYMSLFNQSITTTTTITDQHTMAGDSMSRKKADAAKFLRDTAENVLDYLRSRELYASHPMVPELEANFKMAREKVVALSGGRKRRFEVDDGCDGSVYKRQRSPAVGERVRGQPARDRFLKYERSVGRQCEEICDRDRRSMSGSLLPRDVHAHPRAHFAPPPRRTVVRSVGEGGKPLEKDVARDGGSCERLQKKGIWIDRYRPS